MNPLVKKILKILGMVLGGIAVVIVALVLFVQFGPAPTYEAVEVPALTVSSSPEIMARGKRLVQMNCYGCHSNPESGVMEGQFFGENPLGSAFTANITRDREHGAGAYTPGEMYRLLRTGVKRDHSLIVPFMPKFANMSEEDINAIVAFMQSDDPMLAPSSTERSVNLSVLGKALMKFAWKPLEYPASYASNPTLEDPVEYGRYLVTSQVLCFGCHSASHEVNLEHPEQTEGYLAGGAEFEEGLPSPSLRIAEDGLPGYTQEEFIHSVRNGVNRAGKPFTPPMHGYPQLDSAEVAAIWAYLGTVK